jgi:hypothetical protein
MKASVKTVNNVDRRTITYTKKRKQSRFAEQSIVGVFNCYCGTAQNGRPFGILFLVLLGSSVAIEDQFKMRSVKL